jgi:hypothetical protein
MGELTVLVCSLASVVLVGMVVIVAVVASWERPAAVLGEVREELASPPPDRVGRIPLRALQACEHMDCGGVVSVGHARDSRAVPPARQAPRGGHTELLLDRFAREDTKAMGGELPAVWSAYS